ncbi:MAG: threonine/serine dehydratase [Gammaproteobacteria bacterium]|nr:threonine/serine dehydratase [Gammaproteobacteria bacterium]
MLLPDLRAVKLAAETIKPFIHHTPVIQSQSINQLLGCQVFFKCENFQRTGTFKIRGATNAIACMSNKEAGVITHSSGNHAAALACAAQQYGMSCDVVMPRDVPQFKQQAVSHYGAHITLCEPGMPARQAATAEIMARRPDLKLVHPYDDGHVIAGQGTATLEFIQQVDDLEAILLPVGGGGLISGASVVIQSIKPEVHLIGVEPDMVDEARCSVADGKRHPATGNRTIADGLQAGIGELNFAIIQQSVEKIVSVTEQQIKNALRLIFERLKVVVEPSSAVPLAALLAGRLEHSFERVGIILTGGNLDLDDLRNLI